MLLHSDGFMQDCSISIAKALEILQSCTKPSIHCTTANDKGGSLVLELPKGKHIIYGLSIVSVLEEAIIT